MLFHLHVIGINHKPIGFQQAVTRSILQLLSFVLLGIPYLAIFIHPLRRLFYDRVSESIVISDGRRIGESPSAKEMRSARALSWSLYVSMLIFLSLQFHLFQQDNIENEYISLLQYPKNCKEVVTFYKDGKQQNILSSALSLYAAGVVSQECLNKSIKAFKSTQKEDLALKFFAKSLLLNEDEQSIESYYQKICSYSSDGDLCKFVNMEEGEALDIEWLKVAPDYLKIWSIKELLQGYASADANTLLQNLNPHPLFSSFKMSSLLKIELLANEYKTSDNLLQIMGGLIPEPEREEFSIWTCWQSLANECNASASSCSSLAENAKNVQDKDRMQILKLNAELCDNKETSKFTSLLKEETIYSAASSDSIETLEVKKRFLKATEETQLVDLQAMILDDSLSLDWQFIALWQYNRLSQDSISSLQYWKRLSPYHPLWLSMGRSIANKFEKNNLPSSAYAVYAFLHENLKLTYDYEKLSNLDSSSKKPNRSIASEEKRQEIKPKSKTEK